MTYTHVFLSSIPPSPPQPKYTLPDLNMASGLRPLIWVNTTYLLVEAVDVAGFLLDYLNVRFQNVRFRTPGRCRRWAGVMVRCSTDCGTRKKSTSSSRITFRHSLSRTRVRHFVSLLPAFRFNPVLSFPLTKWKHVQIWRALCLKSNHHSTRLLDSQGNLTTYKAARYNYIY